MMTVGDEQGDHDVRHVDHEEILVPVPRPPLLNTKLAAAGWMVTGLLAAASMVLALAIALAAYSSASTDRDAARGQVEQLQAQSSCRSALSDASTAAQVDILAALARLMEDLSSGGPTADAISEVTLARQLLLRVQEQREATLPSCRSAFAIPSPPGATGTTTPGAVPGAVPGGTPGR